MHTTINIDVQVIHGVAPPGVMMNLRNLRFGQQRKTKTVVARSAPSPVRVETPSVILEATDNPALRHTHKHQRVCWSRLN